MYVGGSTDTHTKNVMIQHRKKKKKKNIHLHMVVDHATGHPKMKMPSSFPTPPTKKGNDRNNFTKNARHTHTGVVVVYSGRDFLRLNIII